MHQNAEENELLQFIVLAAPLWVPIGIALFLTYVDDGRWYGRIMIWWDNLFFRKSVTKRLGWVLGIKKLPHFHREFLFDQLHFYKYLAPKERRIFDHRVKKFMLKKKFSVKEDLELTEEMKVLISATAVQITFGLRSFMLKEFTHIIVYPSQYFSAHSQAFHKGEVNPNGAVVLSWEDFAHGIKIPDDNLNLGIHEFAHTVAIQRIKTPRKSDKRFVRKFDHLMKNVSHPVFRKKIQKRAGLRDYSLTNPMEFFAVATEAFFETPENLYINHRGVYNIFAEMYNLDLVMHYVKPIQPLNKL